MALGLPILMFSAAFLTFAGVAAAPKLSPAVLRVQELADRLDAPREPGAERISFRLAEEDLNEYLAFSLKEEPRPGLQNLRVKFVRGNYISAHCVVDFDEVERARPGTIPSLLRGMISGRKPIEVDLRFRVRDAQVTYSVEKAYFDGIWMPAVLVEKVIEIVAARQPEAYDTTRPLPLPYELKRVWTGDRTLHGET